MSSEKNRKFMTDLHAPEYTSRILFESLKCINCKQGFQMRDTELQFFDSLSEMWSFAKREHRKTPLPCVTPEFILMYSAVILSASIVKPANFDDSITL